MTEDDIKAGPEGFTVGDVSWQPWGFERHSLRWFISFVKSWLTIGGVFMGLGVLTGLAGVLSQADGTIYTMSALFLLMGFILVALGTVRLRLLRRYGQEHGLS